MDSVRIARCMDQHDCRDEEYSFVNSEVQWEELVSDKVEEEVMYCSLSVVRPLFLVVFPILLLNAALVLDLALSPA